VPSKQPWSRPSRLPRPRMLRGYSCVFPRTSVAARTRDQGGESQETDAARGLVGQVPPNGARLSCGALKKNSFPNVRAPPASSAG
jgi:hypothetical protein